MMEQAGYMEKKTASLEEERAELIRRLSTDNTVIGLMKEYGIPAEELSRHPYRIQRWVQDRKVCITCQSLKQCRRPRKGYMAGLSYDGLLQDTEEACRYETERRNAEKHLENYLICDLSEEMRRVNFQQISVHEESGAYLSAMKHAMDCCMSGRGLYLYGSMGTGKTYLAACAANYYAMQGKKTAFVHYPSLCQRVEAQIRTGEYKTETDRMGYADFLVIDDIGAEDVTERNRNILLSVLDTRMQNRRPTWFTSNNDFTSLQQHFSNTSRGEDLMAAMRIMERIRALAETEKITGKDRRNLSQTL